jgi:hypothetical protein
MMMIDYKMETWLYESEVSREAARLIQGGMTPWRALKEAKAIVRTKRQNRRSE